MAATTETTNRQVAYAAFMAQETTPEPLVEGEAMSISYDSEAGFINLNATIKIVEDYSTVTNGLIIKPAPLV